MKFLIFVLLIFSILSCSENNIVSTPTIVPEPTPTIVPNPSKKDMTIDITGFTFQKSEISIEKDTTVTWQNKDSSMHTASSLDYKFDVLNFHITLQRPNFHLNSLMQESTHTDAICIQE